MNELARTAPLAPPAAQGQRPPTGRAIAQLLQRTHDTLLAPWRQMDSAMSDHPGWYKAIYAAAPTTEDLRQPGEHGAAAQRAAEEILQLLPPAERLAEIVDAFVALDAAKPDASQARLLISIMVDGFPNARPHSPEAYLEVLVHEVGVARYPAAVVAQACRVVARTAKFPPAVAEFLEACEKAAEVGKYLERFKLAQEVRRKVERATAEAGRLGPRDLDAEWRERVKAFTDGEPWPDYVGTQPGGQRCRAPQHILAEFGFGETRG